MKIYETQAWATTKLLAKLEARTSDANDRVLSRVAGIVRDVRRRGDKALRKYTAKLDGLPAEQSLLITQEAMQQALQATPGAVRTSLETASRNIGEFARRQMPQEWDAEMAPGVQAGQRVRPLNAVGCYVPSGRYPLPSTLLMTVIPAQVAGVERIVVVSPKPSRDTLAAAALLGVDEFYAMGGAHAIAALAYGTRAIARVDKIVGPGNLYVTAAKKMVAHDCAIDMLAGPTEIGVMSETGDAALIASDLVAQAEHDAETFSVFITTNKKLAKAVVKEAKQQARPNKTAAQALAKHGYVFLTRTVEEARALTNRFAFEHLTVDTADDVLWVTSAGSVFVGKWSAQAFGDYVTGPNHTLPTGGLARVRGGLSVFDYVKLLTVQTYTQEGVCSLGPETVTMAESEGLLGHAEAIKLRLARG